MKGLQDRHEYTITKILGISDGETTIPLIRLRNPHGDSKEWTGDWSDRYTVHTYSYIYFLLSGSTGVNFGNWSLKVKKKRLD